MAGIGVNGAVTTYPNTGEKLCAGCEYWMGTRDVVQMGTGAASKNGNGAMCKMKNSSTYPQQPCTCAPNKFTKWSRLK